MTEENILQEVTHENQADLKVEEQNKDLSKQDDGFYNKRKKEEKV